MILLAILNFLKNVAKPPREMTLEEYIVSNDPQSVHDIEVLEQRFKDIQQNRYSMY